jgi:peptidoglycan/LPS O-acetylase OafA/YrhL
MGEAAVSASLKYEPSLDGLRAVAVTGVIATHAFPQTIPGGWIGVDIFFVLSGYLITTILMTEIEQTGEVNLRRFYFRRFLRLMPPLWSVLLAVLPVILISKNWSALLSAWSAAATYTMNFNRAFAWGPEYPLGHTWSLAAEEQFYLLWPLAIIFFKERKTLLTWVSVLLVAAISWRLILIGEGASAIRIYNSFETHSDPLLIGCAIALVQWNSRLESLIAGLWPLWAAITLVLVAVLPSMSNAVLGTGTLLLGALGAALLISALYAPIFRTALSLRPLVLTGRISYALYLWHFPILQLSTARFHLAGIGLFLPIALSYTIAAISYLTLEAYFRRLKNRPSTISSPALA